MAWRAHRIKYADPTSATSHFDAHGIQIVHKKTFEPTQRGECFASYTSTWHYKESTRGFGLLAGLFTKIERNRFSEADLGQCAMPISASAALSD